MTDSEYHIPVMLDQCLNGLDINPQGTYVDVTFGGGGHSREILKKLNGGTLIAFDQDEDAVENARYLQESVNESNRFIFVRHNFKYFNNFLRHFGFEKVDGILADLGVSSHQFDVAERGFSFRYDAELDMRMNNAAKFSAKELIETYSKPQLATIFRVYGEIKNAGKLADTIIISRDTEKITTTRQLIEVINSCLPKYNENKYLAKLFQALRIEVNKEMEVLKRFLEKTTDAIKPNGRLVVMTYHSLEDRLVKNFIRAGNTDGKIEKDMIYGNFSTPFEAVNKKIIIATNNELAINNRARSAKLRIAKRI